MRLSHLFAIIFGIVCGTLACISFQQTYDHHMDNATPAGVFALVALAVAFIIGYESA